MKLDAIMFWVADVPATVAFYENAFGLTRQWVREEGDYAQMNTEGVTLTFASELAAPATGVDIRANRADGPAPGVQLALATDDVDGSFHRAVEAGARLVAPPVTKPWGQVVAYVRDLDGILVELSSPMED